MAENLTVVFWNVENLFEPGVVPRAPQNKAELQQKTKAIGEVLTKSFDGLGPDLVGVAEIGSRSVFQNLCWQLDGGPFLQLWERSASCVRRGSSK